MTEYQKQLEQKISFLQTLLAPFSPPNLEIFPSRESGYRMRAEFKIWHQDEEIFFAMTNQDGSLMLMENFPLAHDAINKLMPKLLTYLKDKPILRHRLFQVEFHTTLQGEMMVSLIYHKPLSNQWEDAATELAQHFQIQCIGRARKEKRVIGRDFVEETFIIDGQPYHYRQYESSFSQPNAEICQKMISWVRSQCEDYETDLLELYCGNGNFTLPLSEKFSRVLATEISKTGIKALRENLAINQIKNIALARLSAEEFSEALAGTREFRRLKQAGINLQNYQFSTVLVDPPRAGVDDRTLSLLQKFEKIIYISCNPKTLTKNLEVLISSHHIQAAALFDQFPHTPHLESGVILEKR